MTTRFLFDMCQGFYLLRFWSICNSIGRFRWTGVGITAALLAAIVFVAAGPTVVVAIVVVEGGTGIGVVTPTVVLFNVLVVAAETEGLGVFTVTGTLALTAICGDSMAVACVYG